MIAESSQRLLEGRQEAHDIKLIKHEIYEKELIKLGLSQNDAHKQIILFYKYTKKAKSTMLRLKNIKKNNNLITADFSCEGSENLGHISVDIEKQDVEEYSMPEDFADNLIYMAHARDSLLRMVKDNEICSERLVMWY